MPPRSRISEASQKVSPRDAHQQRRSSTESDPIRRRPINERSPKGSQSDPLSQKKIGTRISDLETQLVHAQRELKNLKQQLTSAEVAKNEAHDEPHNKETDVFEVPMENLSAGKKREHELSIGAVDNKPSLDQEEMTKREIEELKSKLEEKEKELEAANQENENLKKKTHDHASEISKIKIKEEEMVLKCVKLEKDLESSNVAKIELREKLEAVELAKENLEVEMKRLRIHTDQWRKAADAAASVLAGDMEVGGRASKRFGSMDKHFNSVFEPPPIGGCHVEYLSSSGEEDEFDDGSGSSKRKGSGIKKFGELWKRKGQK